MLTPGVGPRMAPRVPARTQWEPAPISGDARRLQQARLAESASRLHQDHLPTAQPGVGEWVTERLELVCTLQQCRRTVDHHTTSSP